MTDYSTEQKLDMMFAQSYAFNFLGEELAYFKIFNGKVHRIGNAIMIGEQELKERLSLTDDDMIKLNSFLNSLGLDFDTDTSKWEKKRQGINWSIDAFEPPYDLHGVSIGSAQDTSLKPILH